MTCRWSVRCSVFKPDIGLEFCDEVIGRHSREGGNPASLPNLDFRLRGNDRIHERVSRKPSEIDYTFRFRKDFWSELDKATGL